MLAAGVSREPSTRSSDPVFSSPFRRCSRSGFPRSSPGIDFVGFDVVEVIPAYDPAGQTAFLAANLAYEMLSLVAVRRAES